MTGRLFFASISFAFLLVGVILLPRLPESQSNQSLALVPTVFAESENEHENERGNDDGYSSSQVSSNSTSASTSPQTKTVLIPQAPVTVTKWVPVTKQVPANGYDKDTDGDGIVDALDPHPTIPEQQFFTDSDNDGVPDNDDHFPGHDDFYTFPDNADANMNGILDTYESRPTQ